MIITHYLNKTPTLLPLVYPSVVFSTTHRNIPIALTTLSKSSLALSIVVAARGNLFCASPFHVADLTSMQCT
jgi:hypothetical protein